MALRRRSLQAWPLLVVALATAVPAQPVQKTQILGVAPGTPEPVPAFTADGHPAGSVILQKMIQPGWVDWNRSLGLIRVDQTHWVRSDALIVKLCDVQTATVVSGSPQTTSATDIMSGKPCTRPR